MARILVKLQNGGVGTIEEQEFNPQSMQRLDAPTQVQTPTQQTQVQVPNPPQKDLASSIGGALGDFLKSASKPFRVAGEGAVDIGRLLGHATGLKPITGQEKPVFLSPEENTQVAQNVANPNLLKNSIVQEAAGLGSWAVPFGKASQGAGLLGRILQKAVLPGAAAGALSDIGGGESTPESIAGNAVLGGTGAGAFHALSGILGKGASLAGKGLTNTSDTLALKSLRPSPSQQANFFKDTGEKMGDFIKQRGLQGAGYEELTSKVQPLQETFDQITNNPNLKIKSNDLLGKFTSKIEELNKSSLPEQRAKADYLTKVYDNLKGSLNGDSIGADVATSFRKEADDLISNYKFDDTSKGNLQLLRDIYQSSVRDAADQAGIKVNGMSAKELGVELSKHYKLLDVAEKQQFLGQGGTPMGLTGWLGGGLGGSVAGFPGMLAGVAASKAMSNPKVIAGASKLAGNMGEKLTDGGGMLQKILGTNQVSGQVSSRMPSLLASALQSQVGNQQENPDQSQNQFQTSAPSPENIPQGVNSVQRKITPEMIQKVLLAQASGALSSKAADAITKAYELQEKNIKDSGAGPKELSASAAQMLGKANAASSALDRIDTTLSKNPLQLILLNAPGAPGARQLEADYSSLADAIGGLRTGASVSPEQSKYYRNILPKPGDSPETIKSKLEAVRQELQFYIKNGPAVKDNFSASAQPAF